MAMVHVTDADGRILRTVITDEPELQLAGGGHALFLVDDPTIPMPQAHLVRIDTATGDYVPHDPETFDGELPASSTTKLDLIAS